MAQLGTAESYPGGADFAATMTARLPDFFASVQGKEKEKSNEK